jgi:putative intracellular protease/amidase
MTRGLEGRRIALAVAAKEQDLQKRVDVVRRALEQAGAQVDVLQSGQGSDEDWHGGRYAALVVVGGQGDAVSDANPRLIQLVRELLVSEKPVAACGNALDVIVRAGGAAGRTLSVPESLKGTLVAAGGKAVDEPIYADGSLISARDAGDTETFAAKVVGEFARHLEEQDVDEMSEQSFPASDPPSTTPGSIGPAPGRDSGARP